MPEWRPESNAVEAAAYWSSGCRQKGRTLTSCFTSTATMLERISTSRRRFGRSNDGVSKRYSRRVHAGRFAAQHLSFCNGRCGLTHLPEALCGHVGFFDDDHRALRSLPTAISRLDPCAAGTTASRDRAGTLIQSGEFKRTGSRRQSRVTVVPSSRQRHRTGAIWYRLRGPFRIC